MNVDESALHAFCFSPQCQLIRSFAPSASGKSTVNFSQPHGAPPSSSSNRRSSQARGFVVHIDESSQFVHHLQFPFLLKTVSEHLHRAVTPVCWFAKSLILPLESRMHPAAGREPETPSPRVLCDQARASLNPTGCNLQSEIDGSVGTHTTM